MEKDNYCKKCSWSVCRCETEEPLSSHAVLGEGWRDARKESPEKNIYTSAIIAIYSSESGNKWVTEGRYDGWSGYWEDVRNGTVGIEGDNLTVYAWMPLPDPPAFAQHQ